MDGASSAGSKSCSFSPSPITPENSTPNDQTNANVHEHEGDMPPPPPHPPRSTRRMKSEVWNHFEKLTINGEQKAKCLHCSHLFSGNSKNGTSHLKDHLELRCTKKNVKIDVRQQLLSFNRKQDSSTRLENYNFSQEVSRKELSNMVILHEYPLSIVEHIGFRTFVNSLNPNFKIMSRNTLKSDILRMFASEKVNLKKLFDDHVGRVAITTDMWTATHQKKGYMAITSHFIDEYWVLRNKTLRFVYVPHPHTAIMLAQVLVDTMNMYNIAEKISSVVLDNCSTNDAMVEILQDKFDYDALLCSGEFFHVRCCAHILNLIVQDGLDVIGPGIERIRNCIAFWCGSAKRIEKFEDKARASKVDCSKKLYLDCKTRWNSTFLMLQSALPYKNVFASLKTQNPKFKFVLPNQRDWELAEMICEKLVKFHEATELFSGRKYPTANLFFRQVCEIKLALLEWEKDVEQVIRDMATTMMEKFDKYWSNINGILAVAAILDPRDKLECVEFYFSEIYGERCHVEVDRIKGLLYDLLNEYHDKSGKDGSTFASTSTTSTYIGTTLGKRTSSSSSSSTGTDKWSQMKKTKKRKANVRCEFDHYLEDETLPESSEFDVLNFWKTDLKYPTLRKIAKDILAIPASTVASESAFSIGGRVVSPQRSSLHANTIEALMCMQNWILGEYSENSLKNSQACATILEDVDVGDEGNGTTSTSEVIDVDSDGEDMEI